MMNQIRKRMVTATASVLLSVVAEGCAEQDGGQAEQEQQLEERSDPLFVDVPHLWSTAEISVCWNNRDSRSHVHDWVEAAINRTWEFVADVDFTGWGDCGPAGADLEIDVGDSLPPALWGGLGNDLAYMTLNFDPNSAYCGFGHPDETYQTCMEFIAIHEFAHALGFAHEQNRSDTPAACTELPQGSDGTETYGGWDWDSVTNYCNPAYAAHPRLSAVDVQGSQHYYGMGPRYVATVAAIL